MALRILNGQKRSCTPQVKIIIIHPTDFFRCIDTYVLFSFIIIDLHPLYGRICAAVFVASDGNGELESLRFAAGDDDAEEAVLISGCFDVLRLDCARIVTWNGIGFDLPFLFKRAALLGVPLDGVPVLAHWTRRYSTAAHIDLMQIWSGWNAAQYAKLDDVGRAVVDDHKIKIDVRDFPELVKTEEGRTRILDYCEQDVRLTYKIFKKLNGVLFSSHQPERCFYVQG